MYTHSYFCTQANLFMSTNSAASALPSLCYGNQNVFEFCASVFLPRSFFFISYRDHQK